VPTHLNRNAALFDEATAYAKSGGNIDLTAGETKGVAVPGAIKALIDSGIGLKNVTVSSDANGSFGEKVSKMQMFYHDIARSMREYGIPPENVLPLVTENPARILKLYPKKGVLLEGSDADILIADGDFNIQKLFCRGRLVVDNGEAAQGVL